MLEEPGLFALPSSAHLTRRVNGRQQQGGAEYSERDRDSAGVQAGLAST